MEIDEQSDRDVQQFHVAQQLRRVRARLQNDLAVGRFFFVARRGNEVLAALTLEARLRNVLGANNLQGPDSPFGPSALSSTKRYFRLKFYSHTGKPP
jgi:hypothetical protein